MRKKDPKGLKCSGVVFLSRAFSFFLLTLRCFTRLGKVCLYSIAFSLLVKTESGDDGDEDLKLLNLLLLLFRYLRITKLHAHTQTFHAWVPPSSLHCSRPKVPAQV